MTSGSCRPWPIRIQISQGYRPPNFLICATAGLVRFNVPLGAYLSCLLFPAVFLLLANSLSPKLPEDRKEWILLLGLLDRKKRIMFFVPQLSLAKALMLRIHADLPVHPSMSLDKVLGTSQLGDG